MSENKYNKRKTPGQRLGEAVAVYRVPTAADRDATIAKTRLSGKNQITIPVAMCRLMDMRPGDEIGGLYIDEWAMLAAAAITVWSAVDYLVRAIPLLTAESQ